MPRTTPAQARVKVAREFNRADATHPKMLAAALARRK
jgi:hypothetical protein